MWKCPKCETVNDTDTCVVCGEKQKKYNSNKQRNVYDRGGAASFGGPAITDVPKAPVQKKSNNMIVLLSSVIAVLLALLFALLFMMYGATGKDDDIIDKKRERANKIETKKETKKEIKEEPKKEPEEEPIEETEEEPEEETEFGYKEEEPKSTYRTYKTDVTWEEAYQYSINQGGHLVCINSEEEFEEVCKMAEAAGIRVLWIGAMKYGKSWLDVRWIDGTKMTYTKWLPGEPTYYDEYGNPENYLVILKRGGEWYFNDEINDISVYSFVSGELGYIIEFEDD